eukprot:CAMPEP_0204903526 /NCGR_PEP_ID=MMETSP1397-20131031/4317_1 /ASSEMBLY_ACC=CAM_ASM_000891 /TAXON_ID=49980 /ORGANISM="Climacostomum Climacostomum virens, Strain Stock W-24" /LENGTH=136 /DNA_ID=CAMNT_0052072187 /DNA_START=14 /DNA_END=424 /DNA_ORIENTATION=-
MIIPTLLAMAVGTIVNIDDRPSYVFEFDKPYSLELTARPSTGVIWQLKSTGDACVQLKNSMNGEYIPTSTEQLHYGQQGHQYFDIILQGCASNASYTAKFLARSVEGRAGDLKNFKIVTPVFEEERASDEVQVDLT